MELALGLDLGLEPSHGRVCTFWDTLDLGLEPSHGRVCTFWAKKRYLVYLRPRTRAIPR